MSKRKDIFGIDLADLGSNILSGVHLAGKAILSAFGAGAIAQPLEQLESPYLKDWARTSTLPQGTIVQTPAPSLTIAQPPATPTAPTPPAIAVVAKPDFVIVMHNDPKHTPDTYTAVSSAQVVGGKHFDGNGYRTLADLGKKFSYGFDTPQSVTLVQGNKLTTPSDVKQVLFLVPSGDNQPRVSGDDPIAILEGSETMAEKPNNLNLNDREMADFARAKAGEEFEGDSDSGIWSEIVGQGSARDWHGGFPINFGVPLDNQELRGDYMSPGDEDYMSPSIMGDSYMVGAKKPHPAGGVRNPHGYKHGEFVFGDILGAGPPPKNPGVSANKYVHGTLALAGKPVQHTTPSHAGFQIKTTRKGRQFTSLVLNRQAKHDPQKTIAAAKQIAQRAQQIAQTTLNAVNKGLQVKAAKAAIHGIGAVQPSPGIAALKQAAMKLQGQAKKLTTSTNKYAKVIAAEPAKAKAAVSKAKAITKIQGDDGGGYEFDIVGQIYDGFEADFVDEALGQIADTPVPDPTNPGYLTDGSPDPNYGGAGGIPGGVVDTGTGTGTSTGTGTDAGTSASSVPGPPDYGAGVVPTLQSVAPVAGQDYMADPNPNGDDNTPYSCPTDADLPLGAIIYDGSHPLTGAPTPAKNGYAGVGNYETFFPGQNGPVKGGTGSAYELHDDGWWLHFTGINSRNDYGGGENYDHIGTLQSWMVGESQKNNMGPFIGNPATWEKGLRLDTANMRWFWFWDQAPSWAQAAVLQKRLNDAIVQYQAAVTAGQTDYVNAQLQDKLNAQQAAQQAQAQATQDAQLAMQQQQSDATAAAAQQQQNTQANAIMLQEQQQADQQAAAQAQIQQQAQQAQLAYFAQHPDQMFTSTDDSQEVQQAAPSGDTGDGIDWGTNAATSDEQQFLDTSAAAPSSDNELMQDE